MIKIKVHEDLVLHKINPSVATSKYTKQITLFGIPIHTRVTHLNTDYDDSIFDEKDEKSKKTIGYGK